MARKSRHNRHKVISFRVTETEYQLIKALADTWNCTVDDFIRAQLERGIL